MNRKQELKEKISKLTKWGGTLKDGITSEEKQELKNLLAQAKELSEQELTEDKKYEVWQEIVGGRVYDCYMLELDKKEPPPPPPPTPPPSPKSDSDSKSKPWQGRTRQPTEKPQIIDTRSPREKLRDEINEKARNQRKKVLEWHMVNGTLKWGYYEINTSTGEREFVEVSKNEK